MECTLSTGVDKLRKINELFDELLTGNQFLLFRDFEDHLNQIISQDGKESEYDFRNSFVNGLIL